MQSPDNVTLARALREILDGMKAERLEIEETLELIGHYVLPRKAFFSSRGQSSIADRERMILDGTAPHSLMIFASALQTFLANPMEQWATVALPTAPKAIRESDEVKRYLALASDTIHLELTDPSTGTYSSLHEHYIDTGAFGSGVSILLDDPKRRDGVYLSHEPYYNCWWEDDHLGNPMILARKKCWTAAQATRMFPGVDLGPTLQAEIDGKKPTSTKHDFYSFIMPRSDLRLEGTEAAKALNPYVEIWMAPGDHIVRTRGVDEFRPLISRWTKANSFPYGRSVTMTALGDILMVNRMSEVLLRGAEKLVDPPWIFPDGGLLSPVRMYPGGMSYSDGELQGQPLVAPGSSRIEVGAAMLEQRQQAIRDSFFVPFFTTPNKPNQTATEVLQHREERNRMLAPMVLRQQQELYDRFILMTYKLLVRKGRIPPPPAVMAGHRARVAYRSPLITSQLEAKALTTMNFMENLALLTQIFPKAPDGVDVDAAVKMVHIGTGAPKEVLLPEATVKAKRKQDQAAETAMVTAEAAKGAAESKAKLVSAYK